MGTKQKQKQKIQTIAILQDFLLLLLFNELEVCLFLPLITLTLTDLRNSHTKYFLPRVNIINYNVLLDGRNFYDQPINDLTKQYNEIKKTATGQEADYTTGLRDYRIITELQDYLLIPVDFSKKKELNVDSRAFQQIEFYGILKANSQVCTVLEKSKETMLELFKGIAKVL